MENKKTILDILAWHSNNKKAFRIPDAYKLIYQSVFGVGHLLSDVKIAEEYLEKELDSIVANTTTEEIIEQISPDGEIVRLNLRPFKYSGLDKYLLLEVMVLSANKTNGNLTQFLDRWELLRDAVQVKNTFFTIREFSEFDAKVHELGYPVMHHSKTYRLLNKPAYRVLNKSILLNTFKDI